MVMFKLNGMLVDLQFKFQVFLTTFQEVGFLKEDTGEFVYAILKKQKAALVNPFALRAVSANDARTRDIFYTITANAVTKVLKLR